MFFVTKRIIGGNKTAIEEDQFATTCLAAIAPVFGRAIGIIIIFNHF